LYVLRSVLRIILIAVRSERLGAKNGADQNATSVKATSYSGSASAAAHQLTTVRSLPGPPWSGQASAGGPNTASGW
jgi:hypothetical protein